MRRFCPICGREVDVLIDGMCIECYKKSHPLARIKKDIVGIVRCANCGAILYKGRWVRSEDVIERLIIEALEFTGRISDISLETREFEFGLNTVRVRLKGVTHELVGEYEGEVEVKVRYSEGLCPRCRDLILEKERAVIQVRSAIPLDKEISKMIVDVVRKEFDRVKERAGFVKVEESQNGFDIKLSDQNLARSIASKIHKLLPSRVVESQSVIKGRGDKVVTKLCISVYVLALPKGSVVNIDGKYYYVIGYSGNSIRLVDLEGEKEVLMRIRDVAKKKVLMPSHTVKCVKVGDEERMIVEVDGRRFSVRHGCY